MRSQRGASIIIGIFIFVGIAVCFSLVFTAAKKDDATTTFVQKIVSEWVTEVAKKRVITQQDVDDLILTLASTGDSFDPQITVQILDENPAKKTNDGTVSGVYITVYNTQILEQLPMQLKSGDIISVEAKSTNSSTYDQLVGSVFGVASSAANSRQGAAAAMVP